MKNLTVLILVVLSLFQSCSKDDDDIPTCEDCNFTCLDENAPDITTNACEDNWECSFKVIAQSKVDITDARGQAAGDKNVFQMITSTEGSEAIADDELTHILVFEMDKDQNSFSIEEEAFENMEIYFKRICFCEFVAFYPVVSGCLQGEKQTDGTWFVQGDLATATTFGGSFDVRIDAQFTN